MNECCFCLPDYRVDPFNTRWPGGESNRDVRERLGGCLLEMEQQMVRAPYCIIHEQQMMVISSPLSDFLALWSSHCQVQNRPPGADSADPYYQNLLFSVARGILYACTQEKHHLSIVEPVSGHKGPCILPPTRLRFTLDTGAKIALPRPPGRPRRPSEVRCGLRRSGYPR